MFIRTFFFMFSTLFSTHPVYLRTSVLRSNDKIAVTLEMLYISFFLSLTGKVD